MSDGGYSRADVPVVPADDFSRGGGQAVEVNSFLLVRMHARRLSLLRPVHPRGSLRWTSWNAQAGAQEMLDDTPFLPRRSPDPQLGDRGRLASQGHSVFPIGHVCMQPTTKALCSLISSGKQGKGARGCAGPEQIAARGGS